ncbi:hypothetical protein PRUPE_1G445800 [Prunus persica]|uniref:Uncharacterized protein n=1 Tax=Prunus persica TaxID=3760 RepID=M5XHR5_PRUPE|nr:hypothetical protein PRUPE_1G445800 [Prunus persica]
MNLWQYQVSNEQFKLPPRLINENEDEVSLQQHVQPSPPQKSIMSSHSLTKSLKILMLMFNLSSKLPEDSPQELESHQFLMNVYVQEIE